MDAYALVLADVDWDHMDGGWGVLMLLTMLIFVGLVIAVVVWLARGGAQGPPSARQLTALEVLERRLAEGSLTVEEYRERREALRESGADRVD